ncbi:DUF3846 domain-containing protein [Nocardia sp. NPDC055165]
MKITGIVIPSNHEVSPTRVEIDRGDIRKFQEIVGGRFEAVDTISPPATMWLNDEGLINGLPMNHRSTMFVWAGDSDLRNLQWYCGDVLITGLPDADGNATSVPDELLKLVFEYQVFKTQVQTFGDPDEWAGNNMLFTSYWIALATVVDLALRWTQVKEVRVIKA